MNEAFDAAFITFEDHIVLKKRPAHFKAFLIKLLIDDEVLACDAIVGVPVHERVPLACPRKKLHDSNNKNTETHFTICLETILLKAVEKSLYLSAMVRYISESVWIGSNL